MKKTLFTLLFFIFSGFLFSLSFDNVSAATECENAGGSCHIFTGNITCENMSQVTGSKNGINSALSCGGSGVCCMPEVSNPAPVSSAPTSPVSPVATASSSVTPAATETDPVGPPAASTECQQHNGTCFVFSFPGSSCETTDIGSGTMAQSSWSCGGQGVCCVASSGGAGSSGTSGGTSADSGGTAVDTSSGSGGTTGASDGVGGTTTPSPGAGGIIKCGRGTTMCTLCDILLTINTIIQYLIWISIGVGLAVITAAGIMYIVSTGDSGMTGKAKSAIKNAIIGIIVMLAAYLIINGVILRALGARGSNNTYNLGLTITGWGQFECNAGSR